MVPIFGGMLSGFGGMSLRERLASGETSSTAVNGSVDDSALLCKHGATPAVTSQDPERPAAMFYWQIPESGASVSPDSLAVIAPSQARELTWSELVDRVDRVAALVTSIVSGPGARVGVLMRNGLHQPELYFGITKAGCILVPLNWRLADGELAATIADSGLVLAFVDEEQRHRCPPAVRVMIVTEGAHTVVGYEEALTSASRDSATEHAPDEDDDAVIAYTSGTTGQPKGVVHTHRSLTSSAIRVAAEMRLAPGDVFYTCLPMFFAASNSAMAAPLLRGCTLVCEDFSPARFVAAAVEHKVSATLMVPTMIAQVLREVADPTVLHNVRDWGYAGDAMPTTLLREALDTFGPVFAGYYGQVETGLVGTTLMARDHVLDGQVSERAHSAGRSTIGIEIRLVDSAGEDVPSDGATPGELWIKSPSVMRGYWNLPELTADRLINGWLRTSDIGVRDSEGYVFLVDRASDVIISGGVNVFPRQVENVILQHPDVVQVAVVGAPSETWGEQVVAFLTLVDPAAERRVLTEVEQLCARELAGYKRPRQMHTLADLPRTGSGKVRKASLKAMAVSATEGQAES
jgi:acyl-CoA synthetase (AMP-forming)/AMP-acid ligase II